MRWKLLKTLEFIHFEHHLLPYFGKAYIAYIPNDKIVGLSKIPLVVDVFSRRPQVQDLLT